MIDKKYYKFLMYIKSCPNWAISKEVMYNSKIFSIDDVNILLPILKQEKLIDIYNHDGTNRYRVSSKGELFIKNYKINFKKSIFEKYTFPIITSAISLILGLVIGSMMK